jgi:Ca-activated chloride channel family protein
MFRFQDIYFLYYLAAIPVLIGLALLAFKVRSEKNKKLFKPEIYEFLTTFISKRKRNIKFVLEILALTFIIISLARPQLGETTEQIKMEGIEIIFALDISNSMLAEDLKPNRLEVTKNTISRLLDRISGYKVGLLGFAGSAALMSPLTTDYSAVKMFLESINPDSISTQGTNFESAIQVALESFKGGGIEQDDLTKVNRVIIFISDGEDQDSRALDKIKNLVSKGIRVFAIGAGTAQGAPIPERDNFGQLRGYKKDKSGQIVMSRVNTDFLRQLASAGQGAYYNASFSGDEVKQLETDLNKLEKTEFESDFMKKYDERFQIPLFIAFVLLIIEMTTTERKEDEKERKSA